MEIYVQPKALKHSSLEIKELIQQIEYAEGKLKHINNSLDWNVKSKAAVRRSFFKLQNSLENARQTLEKHHVFLIDTANTYNELDNGTKREVDNFKNGIEFDEKKSKYDSNGVKKEQDNHKEELKFIKDIVKVIGDLYSKYVIGGAGMNGGSVIFGSILKTIDAVFGGADLYQKYKNGSLADPADWVLNISKYCNSLLKSGFSICYSYKNYKNGLNGVAKILTNTEVWKKNIWGKITGKVSGAVKTTQGIVKSKIMNTLMLLGIGIDTGLQAKDSWNKYATDGTVDNRELGAIGVEASTKGLFSVVESGLMLTGVGIPFSLGLSYLDSKYDLSGNISGKIENWADNASENINKGGVEGAAVKVFYHIGKGANSFLDGTKWAANKIGNAASKAKSWLADKFGW